MVDVLHDNALRQAAQPIRVLHVIESLGRGGAERQLVDVVRRMDGSRFANAVCHLYEQDDLKSELTAAGANVVGLQLKNRRDGVKAIARLCRLLREGNFSVLHTWLYDADIFGRLAGRLTRVPLVVSSLQNSWYEPQEMNGSPAHRGKLALVRTLDAWTGKWSRARFVASSAFVKRSMVERLGLSQAHVEVIYNAVDPQAFQPSDEAALAALRDALGLNDGSPVLICVARLAPQKGHAGLLEAMPAVVRQCLSARLLIVGRGDEAARLKEQAARLNVQAHVRFLGQRDDVKELLQLSDVFVFPSLCAEGLPVALIEAMAMRKPCVAWRVEPNPEVIEHGASGLLVEPHSVEGFASAICALSTQADLRQKMGARGRAIVEEKFNLQRTVKQLESLYETGLSGRRGFA
jgi:glycosyltransferase involved in cell wall biosynthesis